MPSTKVLPKKKQQQDPNFCLTFADSVVNVEASEPDGPLVTPCQDRQHHPTPERVLANAQNLSVAGKTLHSNPRRSGDNHGGLEMVSGTGGLSDSASPSRSQDTGGVRAFEEASLSSLDRAGERLYHPREECTESDADRPGSNLRKTDGKVFLCSASLPRLNVSQNPPTKIFKFKPVKGEFEPWYCGVVETGSERVFEKWWECPHCSREFRTRVACSKHCKGELGMYLPHCLETKKGGRCYSGCPHE